MNITSQTVDIRFLTNDDYYKNYLNLLEQLTCTNKDTITYEKFSHFVNSLNSFHVVYVIENDNKIIATGTIIIEPKLIHGCQYVGHIEDIVVDKEHAGKKIGKCIVDKLVEYGKSMNCYKIILDCSNDVEQFYTKCGFMKKGNCMGKYF
jgi:glucosamine-phosphate N-acetyltransferase